MEAKKIVEEPEQKVEIKQVEETKGEEKKEAPPKKVQIVIKIDSSCRMFMKLRKKKMT